MDRRPKHPFQTEIHELWRPRSHVRCKHWKTHRTPLDVAFLYADNYGDLIKDEQGKYP